jgi:hypothetical protein
MVVPSTPLHTTRVLTEDREMWDDVKVRIRLTLTPLVIQELPRINRIIECIDFTSRLYFKYG